MTKKEKYYMLEMFSYPSGANLHVGHAFNFMPADTFARFKKMTGFDVFQPMGFDAFGLPAENYAIKTGVHPKDSTYANIRKMEEQLKEMNLMYDWDAEIITCGPSYYKWTQWLFLKLFERGLAYRKEAPVNYCPSCNTVLANEQAAGGECERCGSAVIQKNLTQWFFKITAYAEELLRDLDALDWPEKTKAMQRNWIGKSEGTEVDFALPASSDPIKIFTTRADTLSGATYVVLAPEHPLTLKITDAAHKKEVEKYIAETARQNEINRLSAAREKTGVFTGAYCLHPLSGKKIPVWTADYALATYGTGAVMGVPAHDERDFAFAKKYGLPVEFVISPASPKTPLNKDGAFTEYGVVTAEGAFKGLKSADAVRETAKALERDGKGGAKIQYRLRDWLISRQRYWGAPVPVIHCPKCGAVPVPEKDLPVELPYGVKFKPTGKSPLAECAEFTDAVCPKCGGKARRDPDTLDTFVCSSWYFLRYPDNKNDKTAFDPKIINKILPVDKYVGGPEHAVMHLLYARFVVKALRDAGYLNFGEPFKSLVHQGMILGRGGEKMSKSKGNTITTDDYVKEYGADILRLYLMFGFDFTEGGAWTDDGIKAVQKYVERMERLLDLPNSKKDASAEEELNFVYAETVNTVRRDTEKFSFNTAIAALMKLTNALYKYKTAPVTRALVILAAPFMPGTAQKLWEKLGNSTQVADQKYPAAPEPKRKSVEIVIQLNSKIKAKLTLPADASEAEAAALAAKTFPDLVPAKSKKIIYVPNRLINFIV